MDRFVQLTLLSEGEKYFKKLRQLKAKNISQAIRDFLTQEISPLVVARAKELTVERLSDGRLKRNIQGFVSVRSNIIRVKFGVFRGPARVYYPTQEYGTKGRNPDSPIDTIFPRRKKFLTIPNEEDPNAFREGATKYPEKLVAIMFHGLRGKNRNIAGALYPKSSLLTAKSLFEATAAYFLATHVDVSPKRMVYDAALESLPVIKEKLTEFLSEMFRRPQNRSGKYEDILRKNNLG